MLFFYTLNWFWKFEHILLLLYHQLQVDGTEVEETGTSISILNADERILSCCFITKELWT